VVCGWFDVDHAGQDAGDFFSAGMGELSQQIEFKPLEERPVVPSQLAERFWQVPGRVVVDEGGCGISGSANEAVAHPRRVLVVLDGFVPDVGVINVAVVARVARGFQRANEVRVDRTTPGLVVRGPSNSICADADGGDLLPGLWLSLWKNRMGWARPCRDWLFQRSPTERCVRVDNGSWA
jgi:hypothetical protein